MNPSVTEPGHASASTEQHRAEAPKAVRCAVITMSDTRTEADDKSGRLIMEALASVGHETVIYRVVKDSPPAILAVLAEIAAEGGIRAILMNGGTGIASRDNTYETISGLLEKRMDGFGEIFRVLSFNEVGAASMLSRAVAGVWRGMVLFSMPGSVNAVRLPMDKLIVPELAHVIRELNK